MTPSEAAAALTRPIDRFGQSFMMDPGFYAGLTQHGYTGFDVYAVGRGGVLGDGDAEVVIAAFGFFDAATLRGYWAAGRAVAPVATTVQRFCDRMCDVARERFGDDPTLGRLAELTAAVVGHADCTAVPLAAGWRAIPRPPDPAGRLAIDLMTLREHRGGLHLLATRAGGVSPRDAVLVNGGEAILQLFGHPGPYDDPDPSTRDRLAAVEEQTTNMAAQAYDVLDDTARRELVEGLRDLLSQKR